MNVQRFKTWIPQSIGGSMLDMAVPASEFDRILAERDALQQRLNELGEQHQGEPVAWMYTRPEVEWPAFYDKRKDAAGWEETPLYTRADPAEVERLRAELKECALAVAVATDFDWAQHYGKDNVAAQVNAAIAYIHTKLLEESEQLRIIQASCPERCKVEGSVAGTAQNYIGELGQELDSLRAKLVKKDHQAAERVRLERRKIKKLRLELRAYRDALRQIDNAASVRWKYPSPDRYDIFRASAEPSAPVERDERGLVELALSEYGSATGKHVLPGGINENQDGFVHGFLVRAALERKT